MTVRGDRPGTRTWRIQAANASPSIAPLMTRGAISASLVGPAMKVCVPNFRTAIHDRPLPAQRPATQSGQTGSEGGFVNEHNLLRVLPHHRHALPDPVRAQLLYTCAAAFGGHPRSFCSDSPACAETVRLRPNGYGDRSRPQAPDPVRTGSCLHPDREARRGSRDAAPAFRVLQGAPVVRPWPVRSSEPAAPIALRSLATASAAPPPARSDLPRCSAETEPEVPVAKVRT